jgi:hypothetical protein
VRFTEPFRKPGQRVSQGRVLEKPLFDVAVGVQHGRVIAVERATDLRKRCASQFARKIHRDLPGEGDFRRPAPRDEVIAAEAEHLGDHTLEHNNGRPVVFAGLGGRP